MMRNLLIAMLGAAAALLGAQERPQLRILAPQTTAALPFLRLADEGLPEGTRLSCELFLNHAQSMARVLRGDVDLLLTGTSTGWENYLAGGPLVLVDTGVWDISSLVGTAGARPLSSMTELAGKRLALPFPGAPLDFQTRSILVREGLNPDRDLQIVYLAFGQSVPLLLQGKLDAAALPEPVATDMVLNRGLSRLLEYGEAWANVAGGDPRSPQVSLFATRAFLAKNASLVRRLVTAWTRASEQVAGDPRAAARAHAADFGLSPEVVAAAAAKTIFWVPSEQENRRRVIEYYEAVKDYLPGSPAQLGRDFFLLSESAP